MVNLLKIGESKIISNRTNFRDRTRSTHYPSDADLIYNLWNPITPPFDPVINLKDLCKPLCPKFFFLENIKGREPQHHIIFKMPEQEIMDERMIYGRYFKHKNAFHKGILEALKYIVWNDEGNRFINSPLDSVQWGNLFLRIIEPDARDAIVYLRQFFQRLQEEGILSRYLNCRGQIFFNLQVFNPEILIPPPENGMPYELALRETERNPHPYRFRWEGPFPGYTVISELNFERSEIVGHLFYTHDFIRLSQDSENFEEYENQMFIIPSLLHLWLIRLALSTLRTEYLQNFTLNFANNEIFRPAFNEDIPAPIDFSRYNIRLETLDRSYTEELLNEMRVDSSRRTAQSLIMLKLIHERRPNMILNTNFECLVPDLRGQFCGLRWNLGCGMRDYVQIPPATVVENVLTFQRYIRDEITLKSSGFYMLHQFINNLLELKNNMGLWVGDIRRRNKRLYYTNRVFDDDLPREQKLFICFWSPFLFISDLEVVFHDEEGGTIITDFIEDPIRRQNLIDLFNNFSSNDIMPIVVGEFPVEKYIRTSRRQQLAIWRACNFSSRDSSRREDESIEDYELRILSRRLGYNDRRAGEGIFGNRVRFI